MMDEAEILGKVPNFFLLERLATLTRRHVLNEGDLIIREGEYEI